MALRGGGGGGGFDSVRRGARGPVRPHQLHRPKDGPGQDSEENNTFVVPQSRVSLVNASSTAISFVSQVLCFNNR